MPGTPADQWAAALDSFRYAVRARYAPSTLERVCKHVRAYARATADRGPWEATPATLAAWVAGVECTEQTRYGLRSSLRTFYRWALQAGRVEVDPTEPDSHRLTPAAPAPGWAAAIAEHRQWLKASGATRETLRLRRIQLTRLSVEVGKPTPWKVTGADLVDWQARHRWGRETARSHRSAVRRFYAWAMAQGYVRSNPAEDLPAVRTAPTTRRPAPDEAYARALATASPRERLMLRLAAELGLRRAEVARLHQWDLVRGDDGHWLEVHGKGGKVRQVPVPDDLAELVRQQPGGGHVFPGQVEGHISPEYVGKMCSRLLPRGVALHSLRHRFATRAYTATHDLLAVQTLLGHSSPTITQRYVQVSDATLRATMAAAR